MEKEELDLIYNGLLEMYPNAKGGLNYNSPFELLVAVMLSAQCTDKRVNEVTAGLFKKYKTPQDIISLGEAKLREIIKPCGLSNSKSNNLIKTCTILRDRFGGKVPENFDDLVSLPGIGRKSANVILIEVFKTPAIPVDTHVFRVSNRIGFTNASNPEQSEKQLSGLWPKENWIKMHHFLINHGRQICTARNPKCKKCKIVDHCGFTNKII